MHEQTNIVVIILDTQRASDLGCYGSREVRSPNIDALAARSTRFARAFPESLPTIPVRRAIYTGRRAFPFRDYRHLKWGTVKLPGWQPISEDEDTLAENLAAAGYQTGFACTTQHCWNPGFNFQRGFWQWEFARGYSGEDRWGSPYGVPRDELARYGKPENLMRDAHRGQHAPMILANRRDVKREEETPTARAFRWGAQFMKDNREVPFYLLIDSFAPHEPWVAPEEDYRLYADPDYDGPTHFSSCYGPADRYSQAEIADMRAHYCGLVTHVDRWVGHLLDELDALGLAGNTAVMLVSDHGTNFCGNPRRIIGKPADSMYPGLMRLPLLARLPGDRGAGGVRDEIVSNLDLTATVYDLAGVESPLGVDGRSLWPLLDGEGQGTGWSEREYATCRYRDSLCYVDGTCWALGDIDGRVQEVFDLQSDPDCLSPLSQEQAASLWERAWKRLLDDAGGEFPDYRNEANTDALGRC